MPLEYEKVRNNAATMRLFARSSGNYPLLSGGRINLYSLFVERAIALVKPDGFVGLLTPSGIYADKTASRFFRSVSTTGRVGGLFDFENRKIFFKDVHASFKFCVLVFGGEERRFDETMCAFFLHDTAILNDPERCFPLAPDDFARVNPNTGTAPIFRTRRDAEITREIYERHPVLVYRSDGEARRAWPIRLRPGPLQHDIGLAPLQDGGTVGVGGLLSCRWQPMEAGGRIVFAVVSREDDSPVRPSSELGSFQSREYPQSVPKRGSDGCSTFKSELSTSDSILGARRHS